MLTTDCLNRLVKLLKKLRSVTLGQRRWSTRYLPCATKLRQQITSRDRRTDVVIRKRLAGRTDDPRTFFQAAAGKQDIGGDDDVVRLRVLDDPIVGLVKPATDNLERDPPLIRNPHP